VQDSRDRHGGYYYILPTDGQGIFNPKYLISDPGGEEASTVIGDICIVTYIRTKGYMSRQFTNDAASNSCRLYCYYYYYYFY